MDSIKQSPLPYDVPPQAGPPFHCGDWLMPRAGYPILCEVIAVEPRGLLRIRGVGWDPGYSAEVLADDMRSVASLLADS